MCRLALDHVALLVSSIEAAVDRLGVPAHLSSIAEFPGEGTRELYLGKEGTPSYQGDPVVTRVGVSVDRGLAGLISALHIDTVSAVADGPSTLTIYGRIIEA